MSLESCVKLEGRGDCSEEKVESVDDDVVSCVSKLSESYLYQRNTIRYNILCGTIRQQSDIRRPDDGWPRINILGI